MNIIAQSSRVIRVVAVAVAPSLGQPEKQSDRCRIVILAESCTIIVKPHRVILGYFIEVRPAMNPNL